jgi:hypothetical protein
MEKNTVTVQPYTRPTTKDDKSLKLEAFEGNQWNASTFELRFRLVEEKANPMHRENKSEAEQYARDLNARLNIVQPIRITPSSDPPNCGFEGGLGAKRLVRFDG